MPTGIAHVDAVAGRAWTDSSVGGDNNITYYLANEFGHPWPAAQIAAYQAATDSFAAVANITFTQQFSAVGADLKENIVNTAEMTTLTGGNWGGYHIFPTSSTPANGYYNLDRSYYDSDGLAAGGFGRELIMHEIAHGIGLAHPHDSGMSSGIMSGVGSSNDTGDNALNQTVYTIMSYNNFENYTKAYGNAITPMAFDIAALQHLYGAKLNHMGGNSSYVLPTTNGAGTTWSSLWDTGGIDEIVHNGSAAATIDLRAATLQNEVGGGGFISRVDGIKGGFTIAADVTNALANDGTATGVIIENAVGGSGNDVITGNGAGNTLIGRGGSDTMYGGDGNDSLHANNVNSTAGDAGITNNLWGGAGDDLLVGGAGDDLMVGGTGADAFYGGDGEDFIYIDGEDNPAVVFGGDGIDRVFINTTDATHTFNAATSGVEVVFGGNEQNIIDATGANNTVYLIGAGGNDTVTGGNAVDVLWGYADHDLLRGNGSTDWLYAGVGADRLDGGTGDDFLIGGAGLGSGDGVLDFFEFNDNWGTDRVYEFDDGVDILDMSGVTGLSTFAQLSISDVSGGAGITFGGNTIYVIGTTASQFTDADFWL